MQRQPAEPLQECFSCEKVDGRFHRQPRRDLATWILNTCFLLTMLLSCVYWDSEWAMAAGEQVIRAPAQLGVALRGVRQQQGLSQQDLALKVGGTSQARLSQLELQPGRLTVERLLLILAALDLELVVRPRRGAIETAEW